MRMRLPVRRIALFGALLALAIVVTLPLRIVLGASGLSAREASGPAWAGRLKEARIGPAALGDLSARLSFLPLLIGQARIELDRPSAAADRFAGAFGLSARNRFVESVTGVVPVDGLFAPLPVSELALTDVTVRFRDGQCDRAEGQVAARLSGELAGLPLPAALIGTVRCDKGALLLPLTSGAGSLSLRVTGDGRYQADLRVSATDPAIAARLGAAGFRAGPGGAVLNLSGAF